jgi:hypothetical protein
LLWRAVPQPDDGRQQLTAMADAGNAEFFKVVRGKIAQYFGADVVLAKRHLVALKAEASQPAYYVHRRSSGSVMLKAEYRRDDRQYPEPEKSAVWPYAPDNSEVIAPLAQAERGPAVICRLR